LCAGHAFIGYQARKGFNGDISCGYCTGASQLLSGKRTYQYQAEAGGGYRGSESKRRTIRKDAETAAGKFS